MSSLSGTALVLGASGALGAAFCQALLDHGQIEQVIGTARDPARIPAGVLPVPLDVRDTASITAACEQVRSCTKALNLVLYCAGVLHDANTGLRPEKRLRDVDADALAQAFAVNATAPLLLARDLHELLPRREPACWANLSARVGSIADNRAGGWYSYRASKAAQNMITRTLAIEWGRTHRHLTCVALHPGTVASDLSAPFRHGDDAGVQQPAAAVDHLLKVVAGLTPADSGKFFAWDGQEIPW